MGAPAIVPDCERDARRARARGEAPIVCGRRDGGRSPHRLAPDDAGWNPAGRVASVSRERNRLLEGGEAGLGSCSNVGPNAQTGCLNRHVWRRREQYGQ